MMTSRKYWCDIWIISIFLCFSGRRRYLPVWQMQETIHFALVVYDPQTRTVHSADASPSVLRNCLSHGTHTHQCSGVHVFTQPDWSGIYSNHIYLMHLATFPHSIIMYSRFMIKLHPIGQYSNQMGWVSDISCCMTITSTYQVVNIWDYIKSCSFSLLLPIFLIPNSVHLSVNIYSICTWSVWGGGRIRWQNVRDVLCSRYPNIWVGNSLENLTPFV